MSMLVTLVLAAQLGAIEQLERAVTGGIRAGVFPGAVVVVGTRDSLLLARGYGHFTWSSRSPRPDPDSTLYDLASLTKVVATTPAIMLLVEGGRMSLDRPVRDYLPEFTGPGKASVTVRHLLAHTSGLPAFLRLDTLARDAAGARQVVLQEPLRWSPGAHMEYSDLNAMLLGWIVERVSGQTLDRFVADQVFGPVRMTQTLFRPPRLLHRRAAPVNLWRGHPIAGAVNDQNAARLGGVAGHAGLFSTAHDLARLAQLFLNGGATREGRALFRPATVAAFTRPAGHHRALGWELRDTTTSDNAGTAMSPAAFGHTGFTGTSLWIDPAPGLFVVILTNRVYAPRARRSITRLKAIRGEIADAAVALGEQVCGPAFATAAAPASSRC
ncbi:MAG: beta-lactamase family protein [Gemmatimonadetes bacterium]|nr:beta-lactamase family protein [Gemmatimonadota bacterium]